MAGNLREHLGRATAMAAGAITEETLADAVRLLEREYDEVRGGFGGAPEVPAVDGAGVPAPAWATRPMLLRTLDAMARGGIYDQLGGGFARYSVDASWVVPHFEKMLYDNAQLLGLYARVGGPALRPGRPGDRRVHAARAAHGRGRLRLGARRGQRGRGGQVLRLDPRRS